MKCFNHVDQDFQIILYHYMYTIHFLVAQDYNDKV